MRAYRFQHEVTVATLVYYRLSCYSSMSYDLVNAFRTFNLSIYQHGSRCPVPAQSDEVKVAAVRGFYNRTRLSTWSNWRAYLLDFGVL